MWPKKRSSSSSKRLGKHPSYSNAPMYECSGIDSYSQSPEFEYSNSESPNFEYSYSESPSFEYFGNPSTSKDLMAERSEDPSRRYPNSKRTVVCEVCSKLKFKNELFTNRGCNHSCCSKCLAMHVESRIRVDATLIKCPRSKCMWVLEPEFCQSFLPRDVFDQWSTALCQSLLKSTQLDDSSNFTGEPKFGVRKEYFDWKLCEFCLETKSGIEFNGLYCIDCTTNGPTMHTDPSFVCDICAETKPLTEIFSINGCDHSYCSDCTAMYVESKVRENVTIIKCPEPKCNSILEPEFLQSILPQEVYGRWTKARCESMIPKDQIFYCPYKDCSALLVNDEDEVIWDCECPHCRRLFCAVCKVPWHTEMTCSEFQNLNVGERNREDILLIKLAKDKKWQRCPKCKYYVERTEGCLRLKCRCGFAFCYNCAAPMDEDTHNCFQCTR